MGFVRKLIVVAVFVTVLVGGWQFAAQNSALIQVHYLAGNVDGVLVWVALLSAFGAGAIATSVIGGYRLLRAQMMTRRYRKLVASLEAEVHQLRTLPLSMDDPVAPGEGPGDGVSRNAAPIERGA